MIEPGVPNDEALRLAKLDSYNVLDTDPESAFDDLSRLASKICGTPIALVSLVDETRQWFKSHIGLDATETPRSIAFCSHAILEPDDVFVVENAHEDERFHDNPLVTGEPRVCFYAGAPLVEPSGTALGTLCVIDHDPRDMTPDQLDALRTLARQVVSQLELRRNCAELSEVATELRATNRELEEFTHIAAHDLQEPLRKIVSFGELLREDLGPDLTAQAAEDVRHMTDASLRMRDLISDLLQLARAGTVELDRRPVDLEECVAAAREALATQIEETGAIVTTDPLPRIEGDRTLLTQLLQNLIGNAIKFVGDGTLPEVRVTCFEEDGETVLGVRDNGIGIDESATDAIFRTFKRLHSRQEFAGTGIGLSIARRAIERHGGRIWVESKPGEGSHFKFVLPGTPAVTNTADQGVDA